MFSTELNHHPKAGLEKERQRLCSAKEGKGVLALNKSLTSLLTNIF